MSVKYNAEEQGDEQVREGITGETGGESGDIRHNAFNLGNQHYGTTGADNDNQTPSQGENLTEMMLGARETSGLVGVGEGQQEPRSGKEDLA